MWDDIICCHEIYFITYLDRNYAVISNLIKKWLFLSYYLKVLFVLRAYFSCFYHIVLFCYMVVYDVYAQQCLFMLYSYVFQMMFSRQKYEIGHVFLKLSFFIYFNWICTTLEFLLSNFHSTIIPTSCTWRINFLISAKFWKDSCTIIQVFYSRKYFSINCRWTIGQSIMLLYYFFSILLENLYYYFSCQLKNDTQLWFELI